MEAWQQEWAYQKYWVMARSQTLYDTIRQLASSHNALPAAQKAAKFNDYLAIAETLTPTIATLTNTYQHVWGYFKKQATPLEKQTYLQLLAQLSLDDDQLGPFLKQLASQYQVSYLLNARIIQEL